MKNISSIVIYRLLLLAKKEKSNKNFFKVKAYYNAVDKLENLHGLYTINDVNNINGIGKHIREKIIKIMNTKRSLNNSKFDTNLYRDLLKIYGVGYKKANILIDSGISSIDDLYNKQFLLTKNQKIGLYYYNDLLKKICRHEMDNHYNYLSEIIHKLNPSKNIQYTITGSYIRGEKFSGDIDLLISCPSILNKLIQYLIKDGYIQHTLALGQKKYMGIVKLKHCNTNRRFDIVSTTDDEYPFALLYFTGNKDLNIKLRQIAHKLGLKLNEKSLTNMTTNKKIILHSEKEIFNYLGFEYKSPRDRNNTILIPLK